MRGTPVKTYKSLTRPMLFCGVEKKAPAIYGSISLIIFITSKFHMPMVLIGPVLFVVCHAFFTWLAKNDPQMIAVYMRHVKFTQDYYPARSGIGAPSETMRPSVYQKRD